MSHWVIADVGCCAWIEFYSRGHRNAAASVRCAFERIQSQGGRPIFCFDKGQYYRTSLFPEYKASRKERDPDEQKLQALLGELPSKLRKAGIPNVLALTGFEADDHMAAAALAVPKTDTAILYTRDRDLLQSIRPHVEFLDPCAKEHSDKWDLWGFRFMYGDLHPTEWAEILALTGCDTDEVPGIEGVGLKTAVSFLTGKMNRLSPTYAKIKNFVGTLEHARNLTLVRLPFAGTPPVELDSSPIDWNATFACL